MSDYVRFQSAVPNRRGTYPGVFALANGLRLSGLLSAEEGEWMDAANARASESYADPRSVDPDCYDRDINPGARAWFRATAAEAPRVHGRLPRPARPARRALAGAAHAHARPHRLRRRRAGHRDPAHGRRLAVPVGAPHPLGQSVACPSPARLGTDRTA
ncbi:hypothetical protein [Clavibacter tessellarius]|uniref:hypothetical protein n=1 Tax=Clavibacter tessellarius TaxID=31965 RepID=UPI0032553323